MTSIILSDSDIAILHKALLANGLDTPEHKSLAEKLLLALLNLSTDTSSGSRSNHISVNITCSGHSFSSAAVSYPSHGFCADAMGESNSSDAGPSRSPSPTSSELGAYFGLDGNQQQEDNQLGHGRRGGGPGGGGGGGGGHGGSGGGGGGGHGGGGGGGHGGGGGGGGPGGGGPLIICNRGGGLLVGFLPNPADLPPGVLFTIEDNGLDEENEEEFGAEEHEHNQQEQQEQQLEGQTPQSNRPLYSTASNVAIPEKQALHVIGLHFISAIASQAAHCLPDALTKSSTATQPQTPQRLIEALINKEIFSSNILANTDAILENNGLQSMVNQAYICSKIDESTNVIHLAYFINCMQFSCLVNR